MEQPRAICVLPWPRAEVRVSVWLSWQRAATHLEVSVHNIMLMDMIDTLQDLTNAMTTEGEKRGQTEKDESLAAFHNKKIFFLNNTKIITYTSNDLSVVCFIEAWWIMAWIQNRCISLQQFFKLSSGRKT